MSCIKCEIRDCVTLSGINVSPALVSKQYAMCAIFTHPLFCRNLKRSDKFLRHSSSEIVFEV